VPGGGPDPCTNCYKSLAVIASGCNGTSAIGAGTAPPPTGNSVFTYNRRDTINYSRYRVSAIIWEGPAFTIRLTLE
jgi:hypothetical protein